MEYRVRVMIFFFLKGVGFYKNPFYSVLFFLEIAKENSPLPSVFFCFVGFSLLVLSLFSMVLSSRSGEQERKGSVEKKMIRRLADHF